MTTTTPTGDTFRVETDRLDVTSLHRPDTSWRFIDGAGHEHRWYVNGEPASHYDPSAKHATPTLQVVIDGVGYWEDGESYSIFHHECAQCGEHIEPRYTADSTTQYIPGLKHCYINDEPVSIEEFERRAREAGLIK